MLITLLLGLVLALAGLGSHGPWVPDEPRVAGIGRSMLDSGDWVVPRLGGEPFLEKPPLYWWVQVTGFELLGVSDRTARLPSGVFSLLALLVTFRLGQRLGGPRAGLLAAAVLATSREYFEVTHKLLVDPALVAVVAAAQLGFLGWLLPRDAREQRRGAVLLGLTVPLAFLAKGLVGPVLCLGPPLLLLLATGRARELRRAGLVLAVAVLGSLALVLPWLLLLAQRAGATALREVALTQTLGRVVGSDAIIDHAEPVWYYLASPEILAPWVLAVPALIAAGVWRRRREDWPPAILFMLFVFGVALLSLPSGKRGLYLLPLVPGLCAVVGWWLSGAGRGQGPRRLERGTLLLLLGLVTLLVLAVAVVASALVLVPAADLPSALAAPAAGLSPWQAGVLAALALAATVAQTRQLVRQLRTPSLPNPAWILVPLALLLMGNLLVVEPFLDRRESLRPLMAAVERLIPGDGPVVAWRPREGLLGMIAYDLQRPVHALRTKAELLEQVRAEPGRPVLFEPEFVPIMPAELQTGIRPLFALDADHEWPHAIGVWDRPADAEAPRDD